MIALLTFVLTLSVLVLVHEFGHFIAARRSGVTVHEFGLGYPPRLFAVRKGPTEYSFNLVPFGGFVKLEGESGESPTVPGSFRAASIPRRSLILVSGVAMNLLLTVVLLTVTITAGTPQELSVPVPPGARDVRLQVVEVVAGSPAANAGITAGDRITAIDGNPVISVDDLRAKVAANPDQPHQLTVLHGKTPRSVQLTAVKDADGAARLGVAGATVGRIPVTFPRSFGTALRTTAQLIGSVFVALGTLLRDLVVAHRVSPDLTGPIGIAVLSGQVAASGFLSVLQFIALLSVSLAVINILPLPALDGGRLLFTVIEAVLRRPVNPKVESTVHTVGFYLLIVLVIAVSVQDVHRFKVVETVKHLLP